VFLVDGPGLLLLLDRAEQVGWDSVLTKSREEEKRGCGWNFCFIVDGGGLRAGGGGA
jgi:hypothetical protein